MLKYIFLIIVSTLLISCSSINTKRFEEFESTIGVLNSQSLKTLSDVEKNSREAGVRKLSEGKEVKPSAIKISVKDFDWKMDNTPTYLRLRRAKVNLVRLNHLLEDYASLLSQVAGTRIKKVDTFSSLAKDLNQNTQDLHNTLGGEGKSKSAGLLSAGAITALEVFINGKREKYLKTAVKNNQSYIESHVQLMVDLVVLMKELVTKSYSDRFTNVSVDWVKAANKESDSRTIYDLNDSLIDDLQRLDMLRASLFELPGLHKALSLKEDGGFSTKVRNIQHSVKRFQEFNSVKKE